MQLFTIGLWKLNKDGTFQLDETGRRIPTYSNEDVMTFARSWTGFDDQPVIAPPLGFTTIRIFSFHSVGMLTEKHFAGAKYAVGTQRHMCTCALRLLPFDVRM